MPRDLSFTGTSAPSRESIPSSALHRDVLFREPLHSPHHPHLVEDPSAARICRISCPNTLTKSCPRKKSGSGARSACSRENDSQRNRLYVRYDSVDTRTPRIYRNFGSLMSIIHPAYRFSSSRRTETRSAASSHSHRDLGSG